MKALAASLIVLAASASVSAAQDYGLSSAQAGAELRSQNERFYAGSQDRAAGAALQSRQTDLTLQSLDLNRTPQVQAGDRVRSRAEIELELLQARQKAEAEALQRALQTDRRAPPE